MRTVIQVLCVAGIIATIIFRDHITRWWNIEKCTYRGELEFKSETAEDLAIAYEALTRHFKNGEEFSAEFSGERGEYVVTGKISIPPEPVKKDSVLANKLRGSEETEIETSGPTRFDPKEHLIWAFFRWNFGPIRFFLVENDPNVRMKVFDDLQKQFPSSLVLENKMPAFISLAGLSQDQLDTLVNLASQSSDHRLIADYRKDLAALVLTRKNAAIEGTTINKMNLLETPDHLDESKPLSSEISLGFTEKTGEELATLTKQNIGNFLTLAVGNDALITAAISQQISGGQMKISNGEPRASQAISTRRMLSAMQASQYMKTAVSIRPKNFQVFCK